MPEEKGLNRKVSALEVSAVKEDDQDDSTMIDLNPAKSKTKTDNIFMDFMALYSRASHNDKKQRSSSANKPNYHQPKMQGIAVSKQ